LKLNFDGASKGNSRIAGAGGAIKDNGRKIICLYATSVGNTTNNATEFGALEQGMDILIRESHANVTVEGESTLVIGTAKILQC